MPSPTPREVLESVLAVLRELEEEYCWGGSEDANGTLGAGYPDFKKAKADIRRIFSAESDTAS